MRSIMALTIVCATLAACNTSSSVSTFDRTALSDHEHQWAARSFHSYTFDYNEQNLGMTANVHITVQNDTVASVIDIGTGQPPAVPRSWPTIDALFAEADIAVQESNVRISLEYDDQYGYLTLFSEQSTFNNPGGGFLARVTNLQPTP